MSLKLKFLKKVYSCNVNPQAYMYLTMYFIRYFGFSMDLLVWIFFKHLFENIILLLSQNSVFYTCLRYSSKNYFTVLS